MTAGLVLLVLAAEPLQPLIDAAPAGSVLRIPPGTWRGPVRVGRPLTLEGEGKVRIEGRGHGSVIEVTAPDVTLSHLTVSGSGRSHDQLDAAVLVTGQRARVRFLTVEDALFGVVIKGADDAQVCGCRIASVDWEPGLRGDAVRVWNGTRAVVSGNEVADSRDVTLANAPGNVIRGNYVHGGRFGVQLVFSPGALLEDNRLEHNLVGVAALYSDGVTVRHNRIAHSMGASGACLTFKDSGRGLVEDNEVLHCAVGARLSAPTNPDNVVVFQRNHFAHNVAAMDFYGENGGHVLHDNRFTRNLRQVTVSAPMSARGNDWAGNAWDDYQGFDRDHDGVGDTPYELFSFTDSIYMEVPKATFFRNSPALELLDFLERLAPFSAPELTLSDAHPRMAGDEHPPLQGPFVPSCPGAAR